MPASSSICKFIFRRSLYSVLIILGVLLLTFLLFRVAAGDPARTVLGKNPSPKEVEALRMTLSSGKPLIWGNWRKTEIFTSANFAEKRKYKGIIVADDCSFDSGSLALGDGKMIFSRNFDEDDIQVKLEIKYKGDVQVVVDYGKNELKKVEKITSVSWASHQIEFAAKNGNMPKQIVFSAPEADGRIEHIDFQRQQESAWDSQLFASLKEIIWFKGTFPYISFFNFGRTLITREPVKHVLKRGVGPSLALMVPIFLGELLLGIVFALISAACRDKWPDRIIMLFSIAGMSISYIVFMIFGQWYLAYHYNFFPIWGFGTLKHLILPVTIGIISGLGGGVRFYRTIFLNELKKEYLRTAEAKGCSVMSIYCKHLLRNAAVPLITRASTILPFLFTGSLLLESFFGIPGLGYAGVNALMNSDLQMLKALVILTAILFVAINLIADITYAWADPRARCE
jgi:peptide/nickel transport system permease protein